MPHREDFIKPLFIKKLQLVILFVTSVCNARCRTCFYWLELNKKGDLTFDELTKLSSTMPEFHDLWVSGGEPFLRKDLAGIIELFYQRNRVRDVRIPTNGIPTAKTVDVVRRTLERCPELQLEIDFSIDGLWETHDKIRGVPHNFEMALRTLSELQTLRKEFPNLTLYVNTVITKENEDQISDVGTFFKERANLDGHYFQIIRGDPMDPSLQSVRPEKMREIYNQVFPLNSEYSSKRPRKTLIQRIQNAYWKAGYTFSYETQYQNFATKRNWKMPCTAGQTSVVIDYNGDVRVCELRKPIGNLRKHNMDFEEFWDSWERKREVRRVAEDKCFCTHVCFMYDSMRHSKRVMLWELPKLSVQHALGSLLRSKAKVNETSSIGQTKPQQVVV